MTSSTEQEPGPAPSKSAKVLRRTLVGGGLTLALATLLWLAGQSTDGMVVLVSGTVLSALAVLEVGRMGSLAGRGLTGLLLPPVAALYLFNHVLTSGGAQPKFEPPELVASLALVLLVTTAAFVERHFTMWKTVGLTWALLALGVLFLIVLEVDLRVLHIGWVAAVALVVGWLALLGFVTSLRRRMEGEERPSGLGRASWLALWIVFPLPALVHVWWTWGVGGLVALMILAKLGDIAGYYVGNAIGKRHPFPNLSPGKTVAGCVASLVAGTLAGAACVGFGLLPDFPFGLTGGLVAGAVINLAAQAGDLLESKVKRASGVKDSGTWFGPSGGVLDLVDSLLLGVPAALVAWPLIFA